MEKTISQNTTKRRVFWICFGIFIFMILFIVPIFVDVEGGTAKNKRSWFGKLNIQKIGTALLQYSEKNSDFPKNLQQLTTQYLDKRSLVSPMDSQEYLYLSGFDASLPHNIPILTEKTSVHTDSRGNFYAMVLYGDFTVEYIRKENHEFYLQYMQKMQKILKIKESSTLLQMLNKELEFSKNIYVVNTILWRLGKAQYIPAFSTVKKCQKLKYPVGNLPQDRDLYYQAKSIALQANYTLSIMKKQFDKDFVKQFLYSKNYFHRKRAWITLYPNKAEYIAVSPNHAQAQEN